MIEKHTDITLIEQALKGEQLAYKMLYQKYKQRLFIVCLRYMKEKGIAEDCLQEGFINIFKHLHTFNKDKGLFESWSKRIITNVCLEKLRKSSLYLVEVSQAYHLENEEADALSKLSFKEMLHLIQELPTGYRTVFNMYVLDGYTHREIADALDISASTSKTQLRKARLLLKKKLTAKEDIIAIDHG